MWLLQHNVPVSLALGEGDRESSSVLSPTGSQQSLDWLYWNYNRMPEKCWMRNLKKKVGIFEKALDFVDTPTWFHQLSSLPNGTWQQNQTLTLKSTLCSAKTMLTPHRNSQLGDGSRLEAKINCSRMTLAKSTGENWTCYKGRGGKWHFQKGC